MNPVHSTWIDALMPHLIVAPILLPMLTGALMLLISESRTRLKIGINLLSTVLWLSIAISLLMWTVRHDGIGVYTAANWRAPFGIVLVVDRFSSLMLVLAGTIAVSAALFSTARWHKAGVHFHPLFQFQLMGLAGSFLTGDLFNLFVFFEIMLAASYGLLLHGSGKVRVQAGLKYIVINLAASSLFLVGVSMLYGITGTLNMADMAQRISQVAPLDRGVLHAATAIIGTAFLVKAAMWPLNFWLVSAYSSATAPVGALFAIMTKVGLYVIIRLWTLLFSDGAGVSAQFGSTVLIYGGIATLIAGSIGMLGSQRLGYLAGYAVLTSSGTLIASTGFGNAAVSAGALFYMISSALAACLFFLLSDLIERWRNDNSTFAPHEDSDHAPYLGDDLKPMKGLNLDEDETLLVGKAIPAGTAFLGLAFICCTLLVTGMPPLSGFIGKFGMLTSLLKVPRISTGEWIFFGALITSGLFGLIAMSRTGIRNFWSADGRGFPQLRVMEGVPVAALILCCVVLTVQAGPMMKYLLGTTQSLYAPKAYIDAVMNTRTVPNPPKVKP